MQTPDQQTPKQTKTSDRLEVFFDGQCPMCAREINMLRAWDSERCIQFTDIAADDFDPGATGKTLQTLMQSIHARLISHTPNQGRSEQWLVGVDVFREMYGRLGFGRAVQLTRLPIIRHLLAFSYRIFAHFRYQMAERRMRRCSQSCGIDPAHGITLADSADKEYVAKESI